MRIAILGMAKSGTTALFYKCRAAMPAGTVELFEPTRLEAPVADHVIFKGILNALTPLDVSHLHLFGKQILITRDPRDRLVSGVLYRVFGCVSLCASDAGVRDLLALLDRKQRNPRSVAVREILALILPWSGSNLEIFLERFRQTDDYAVATHDALPDLFPLSYEDMVDGRMAGLEAHLGLTLGSGAAAVPGELARVVRSRRHGNWRHWLRPDDVDWLRPAVGPFMQRYGYADDWTLASEPVIEAAHATGYVRRLVRERREIMHRAGELPERLALEPPTVEDEPRA